VTQKQDYLIRIVFDNDRTWLLGSIAVDRSIIKARNGGEDDLISHNTARISPRYSILDLPPDLQKSRCTTLSFYPGFKCLLYHKIV